MGRRRLTRKGNDILKLLICRCNSCDSLEKPGPEYGKHAITHLKGIHIIKVN